MIPARSAGANPVRTANANCGDVSQSTSVMPMPPRSIAEISSANAYNTRVRPSRPPPNSRACFPIRVSGTTNVTNASVRTAARVRAVASSSFIRLANSGPSGRRCVAIHCCRSAPSSGTVRTRNTTSLIRDARAATSRSSVRPRPYWSRRSPSAMPTPGCRRAAVIAHVRRPWSWMTAYRVCAGPFGVPSWTSMPVITPGRSASSSASTFPMAALLRHDVHPNAFPMAKLRLASSHPVADRPRTGTTTSTVTAAARAAHSPASAQRCWLTATNTGMTATVNAASRGPVNPKKNPTRSGP